MERPDWSGGSPVAAPAAPAAGGALWSNWGSGGDNRSMVPTDPQSEIDGQIVASGALTAAEVADMRRGPVAPAQDGKPAATLPAIIADEMRKTADGYDAQLGLMRETAIGILEQTSDPKAFADLFDELSPAVQTKAYRVLMHNPGTDLFQIWKRVKPQLTLTEAAEARAWVRRANALLP